MLVTVIDLALPALIAANGVRLVLARLGVGCGYRGVVANMVALATLVPVGSTSLGGVYLSLFGTPSAATIVVTAIYAMDFLAPGEARARPSLTLLALIAIAGLLLYPATAGLAVFDPYDLGFSGWTVPALMALIAIAGWALAARDVAWWVALAAALFLARAANSHNLWDYLIDPFAMIVAVALLGLHPARLVARLVARLIGNRRAAT
jgi:uncharacterized membrane protein